VSIATPDKSRSRWRSRSTNGTPDSTVPY